VSPPASPKPVRRRDREQTIKQILDAAEDLLDRKGPDGFGLAELGREAGVSFGLIHHYFGGKEGLLKAVLRRTLKGLGREIRALQQDGRYGDPESPVVVAAFDTFTRRPGVPRMVAWGLLTGLLDADDLANEFSTDRDAVAEMLEVQRAALPEPATLEEAAMGLALMLSTILGFNLLRPIMSEAFGWDANTDKRFRSMLVKSLRGLSVDD